MFGKEGKCFCCIVFPSLSVFSFFSLSLSLFFCDGKYERVWDVFASGFNIKNKLIHSCVHEKSSNSIRDAFSCQGRKLLCGFSWTSSSFNRSERTHIFIQPLMTLPIIFTNKNQYSNVRAKPSERSFWCIYCFHCLCLYMK